MLRRPVRTVPPLPAGTRPVSRALERRASLGATTDVIQGDRKMQTRIVQPRVGVECIRQQPDGAAGDCSVPTPAQLNLPSPASAAACRGYITTARV